MKIRTRTALWITLAGIFASLALSLVMFSELIGEPYDFIDEELTAHAESFMENYEQLITSFLYHTPYWVRIIDENNTVMYSSDMVAHVDLPLKKDADRYTIETDFTLNQFLTHPDEDDETEPASFRVLVHHFDYAGNNYIVQIARPIENLRSEIHELILIIGTGLIISALLLIFVSYYVSGRILRPIKNINDITRAFNENALDRRISLGKEDDEIFELSSSLNSMFDRLQFSFLRQKEFIANAAHELKTPITLLRLSLAELLNDQGISEQLKEKLSSQNKTVLRMDRLTKSLLSLSSLEVSGRLNFEEFIINDLITDIYKDFQPILQLSNIQFIDQTVDQISVRADKEKIKRLLINLFENSIKYNKQDGEIRVHVGPGEGTNDVFIDLFNTGCGIPNKDFERVFEQFYRVEKSRSTELGGAGLGLSISKKIVELHRGTISIQSKHDSWVQVNVVLPILKNFEAQ